MRVKVTDLQSVIDWQSSLRQFGNRTLETLRLVRHEIQRTEDWLRARSEHWRRLVEECRVEKWRARERLEQCESSDDDDCREEERAFDEASRRLREVEAELENTLMWRREVRRAAEAYTAQANRMGIMVAREIPHANEFLEETITACRSYLNLRMPADAYDTPSGTSGLATTTGGSVGNMVDGANSEEILRLRSAFVMLAESPDGAAIARSIEERGVPVLFVDDDHPALDGAVAAYDGKRILLARQYLRRVSAHVLAAHLAHEGTHLQWDDPMRPGRPYTLEEEYHARLGQTKVWRWMQMHYPGLVDTQCDAIASETTADAFLSKWMIAREPAYYNLRDHCHWDGSKWVLS